MREKPFVGLECVGMPPAGRCGALLAALQPVSLTSNHLAAHYRTLVGNCQQIGPKQKHNSLITRLTAGSGAGSGQHEEQKWNNYDQINDQFILLNTFVEPSGSVATTVKLLM